jgi:hypothetical protein
MVMDFTAVLVPGIYVGGGVLKKAWVHGDTIGCAVRMSVNTVWSIAFMKSHLQNNIFELELKTLYAISQKIGGILDLRPTGRSAVDFGFNPKRGVTV